MLAALIGGTLVGAIHWGQPAIALQNQTLTIAPTVPALTFPQSSLLSQSLPMLGQDAIPYPPELRHTVSAEGSYHLILTLGQDAEGVQRTTASLFEATGDRCQQVWSHRLPHSYGPRLALVNDAGTVVLLDEWINVASPYAIMVMEPEGEVTAQHSFDDIVEITGQSRAEVVEQAAQGFWLAGSPELKEDGSRLAIPTAGGQLTVDMTTGAMEF